MDLVKGQDPQIILTSFNIKDNNNDWPIKKNVITEIVNKNKTTKGTVGDRH